jgi:hypothetical protein
VAIPIQLSLTLRTLSTGNGRTDFFKIVLLYKLNNMTVVLFYFYFSPVLTLWTTATTAYVLEYLLTTLINPASSPSKLYSLDYPPLRSLKVLLLLLPLYVTRVPSPAYFSNTSFSPYLVNGSYLIYSVFFLLSHK